MGSYLACRGISARLIGNIAVETGVAMLVSIMSFLLLSLQSYGIAFNVIPPFVRRHTVT